jgi:type VI secretion system secreted protein VgrG
MANPADPRGISITTPLGPDAVFLTGFRGREAISQLFHFQLDIMAENRQGVAFDKLIGQKITFSILLPDGKTKRFWSGICSSLAQTGRDATFTTFRMEMAPQLWLLTRRTQCRIFQHLPIPEILKQVLRGLDIKLELQGTFEPRDYCVQYRETDFAFASRLMEEEGIYYFFKHTDGGHQMVLGNSPQTHAAVAFSEKAIYEELEGGNRPDMRVSRWEKTQELRAGKVTLWDHCFELPHQHLDAERPTQESVTIGKVTHKLKLAANEPLERFDYPGAYAQRFDGIDSGGGDQVGNLAKIFQDNKRTVAIRMEQEAVQAITIRGAGNCRQFMAGHKFTLERHYDADGAYVLTSVEHSASASAGGRSGVDGEINYQNHFTCIPVALPFRPPQTTEKPVIPGPQTAIVVGPPGEIIFCDKYGRIKVQFHWDRQGKMNPDSSCWIRVSNNWGGANWGGLFLPHVKQEVIVEFEEGDPDRPIVTGRVYNAECMPPVKLPDNKTQSVISDHGGNHIKIEGDKGKEQIHMFSPHSGTHFTLGCARNPAEGASLVSEGHFTAQLGKTWDVLVNEDYVTDVLGGEKKKVQRESQTYVHGYYIQWVAGTVSCRFLGKATTFIGGMETTITIGVKNEVLAALNNRLIKGGLIEINSAKELLKAPSFKSILGAVQVKYGKWKLKVAEEHKNVAGAMRRKAAKMASKCDEWILDSSGNGQWKSDIMKLQANNIKHAASEIKEEGSTLISKGKKKIDGKLIVNGAEFKVG